MIAPITVFVVLVSECQVGNIFNTLLIFIQEYRYQLVCPGSQVSLTDWYFNVTSNFSIPQIVFLLAGQYPLSIHRQGCSGRYTEEKGQQLEMMIKITNLSIRFRLLSTSAFSKDSFLFSRLVPSCLIQDILSILEIWLNLSLIFINLVMHVVSLGLILKLISI